MVAWNGRQQSSLAVRKLCFFEKPYADLCGVCVLHSCKHCGFLYTGVHRDLLCCYGTAPWQPGPPANPRRHSPDKTWRLSRHVTWLVRKGLSPRQVFWQLWGALTVLECRVCRMYLPACHYDACAVHPAEPRFAGRNPSGARRCTTLALFK